VSYDSIVGGSAATPRVDDADLAASTTLPTRPDDTGLPMVLETMLVEHIDAAFVPQAMWTKGVDPWSGTFDDLEAELRRDGATRRGKDGRGVVMSAFGVGPNETHPKRGMGRWRQGHLITSTKLLGLDFDSRAGDPESIVAAFRGYDAIIYSTHSHGRIEKCRESAVKSLKKQKPAGFSDDEVEALARSTPRFRLLLRLARPVTDDEYRRLWHWADTLCGGGSDAACKDPTRLYYTPRVKADDAVYEPFFIRWRGDALDPDALLDGRKVGELPHPVEASSTSGASDKRKGAVSVAEAAAAFALLDGETQGRVRDAARARVTSTIERLRKPEELESRRKHLFTCGCRIGGLSGVAENAETFVEEMVELTLQTALAMEVPDAWDHERHVRNGVHKGQQDHVPVEELVFAVSESKTSSTKKGKLRTARVDEVLALVDNPGLVYDEFLESSVLQAGAVVAWATQRPGPRKLDDQDAFDVTVWLAQDRKIKCDEGLAGRCLWRASKNRPVDSLRDYLRGLRWDGVKRLDSWLSLYLGADDSDYTTLVGRKWLIGAVARALDPGCKNDNVLVLEGNQGLQKSTALRVLGGSGRFFTDQLPENLGDKDASLAMNGTWIVEMQELHSLSKTRVTTTKAFITRQVDVFRPPYGRNVITTPRRSVLAGTTNKQGYLVDDTGNRRFWPVACGGGEREGDAVIASRMRALREDVDSLWAEAVVAYDAGEPWWLTTTAEVRLASEAQEDRVVENPLALELERRLASKAYTYIDANNKEIKGASPVVQLTMEDALALAYDSNESVSRKDTKVLAQVLVNNGFKRVRVMTHDKQADGGNVVWRPWVYLKDGYKFCQKLNRNGCPVEHAPLLVTAKEYEFFEQKRLEDGKPPSESASSTDPHDRERRPGSVLAARFYGRAGK